MLLSFLKLQYLFLLQRDADVDRKIQDSVVTEGGIICQLPRKKIETVIVFLGCFYVFNVSYTQCKAILTFLDQALLESGVGQTLVNASSLFNDLANAPVLAECKFRTTSRGVAKLSKFFSWKFSFTLIDQDLARFFKHNICGVKYSLKHLPSH